MIDIDRIRKRIKYVDGKHFYHDPRGVAADEAILLLGVHAPDLCDEVERLQGVADRQAALIDWLETFHPAELETAKEGLERYNRRNDPAGPKSAG